MDEVVNGTTEQPTLKVLFLSSDTGGGHRASAESLANQFKILYPGTTYDLLDVFADGGVPPYNTLVESYKHLSAHPSQWNLVYKLTNSRAMELIFDTHSKLMCERAIRESIQEYGPDVVVSVHPVMTNVPILSCAKISEETGRHLPIFTVVTDLGSAHCAWFANGVDKMFIASDQIRELAKSRGNVPDEKLVQIGLPIRHQFAVQAKLLGDRMSDAGKTYQRKLRSDLDLPYADRKTIIVMGGGEGVGSLSNIVDALYYEFAVKGIDAVILVVCGRNEKLKNDLETRDWDGVVARFAMMKGSKPRKLSNLAFSNCKVPSDAVPISGCFESSVTKKLRKILSSSSLTRQNVVDDSVSMSRSMSLDTNFAQCKEEEMSINENEDKQQTNSNEETIENESPDFHFSDTRNLEETDSQIYDITSDQKSNHYPNEEGSIETIEQKGSVAVVGLGFVTTMAEYMAAADVLVSKAGPGTIAEAAAVSLPVMLTSFLPGQEEGNVDFVVDGEFGVYISDTNPSDIAREVAEWLMDENKMAELSEAAKAHGAPNAARDIVKHIGDLALQWKNINDGRDKLNKAAVALKGGVINNS